jgi:hypothetical protein
MHRSLTQWCSMLTSILILPTGIGSIASPSKLRPFPNSSSRIDPTSGFAMPSGLSLERRATSRSIATRPMVWTMMVASHKTLSFYTTTPVTKRSEGCSRPILTLDTQSLLPVLPPVGGLGSVVMFKGGMQCDVSCQIYQSCYYAMPCTSYPTVRATRYATSLSLSHTPSLSSWKRRQYILNYTQHRSREPGGNDILSDINSVRNGLFLNNFSHIALGVYVAFLKVCDGCMTPNQSLMASMTRPPTSP